MYSYVRTTNYLASHGYDLLLHDYMHEVEFRLIRIFDQSARHHISKLYS